MTPICHFKNPIDKNRTLGMTLTFHDNLKKQKGHSNIFRVRVDWEFPVSWTTIFIVTDETNLVRKQIIVFLLKC